MNIETLTLNSKEKAKLQNYGYDFDSWFPNKYNTIYNDGIAKIYAASLEIIENASREINQTGNQNFSIDPAQLEYEDRDEMGFGPIMSQNFLLHGYPLFRFVIEMPPLTWVSQAGYNIKPFSNLYPFGNEEIEDWADDVMPEQKEQNAGLLYWMLKEQSDIFTRAEIAETQAIMNAGKDNKFSEGHIRELREKLDIQDYDQLIEFNNDRILFEYILCEDRDRQVMKAKDPWVLDKSEWELFEESAKSLCETGFIYQNRFSDYRKAGFVSIPA
jgi:hypothetical protein